MKALVACRIFEDELRACLGDRSDVTIHWVEAALHADLGRLEEGICRGLHEILPEGGPPYLLFGTGCHPELKRIAEENGMELAPYRNCLEWMVGPRARELEKDRTMLMTPAWVRTWPSLMAALGWDVVETRIQLGRYDQILVLDAGLNPLSEEEILSFFDLVQVPLTVEPVDIREFCTRLRQFIG